LLVWDRRRPGGDVNDAVLVVGQERADRSRRAVAAGDPGHAAGAGVADDLTAGDHRPHPRDDVELRVWRIADDGPRHAALTQERLAVAILLGQQPGRVIDVLDPRHGGENDPLDARDAGPGDRRAVLVHPQAGRVGGAD